LGFDERQLSYRHRYTCFVSAALSNFNCTGMYVCMCVCMYVCMYICMYIWLLEAEVIINSLLEKLQLGPIHLSRDRQAGNTLFTQ